MLNELELRTTIAEKTYSHLEPWIQWPTVYTGLNYAEHKIFRLGDAVEFSHDQIFEVIEQDTGQPIVAVSPMNAVNRVSDKSVQPTHGQILMSLDRQVVAVCLG